MKTLPRQTQLLIVLGGLAVGITLLSSVLIKNIAISPTLESTSAALPVRLKIPEISVDAVIESVGVTAAGDIDAPAGPANVAWFNLGPRPGDNGSAVITGHYGYWNSKEKSVFDDLKNLRKGDRLFVTDETGTTTVFVVRKLQIYNQTDNTASIFGSTDGRAHLNLITCAGEWDKVTKTYSERLVVFTDKE